MPASGSLQLLLSGRLGEFSLHTRPTGISLYGYLLNVSTAAEATIGQNGRQTGIEPVQPARFAN